MEKTLEKLISNNNRGLFLLDPPTGFGKTTAVIDLIKRFLKGDPCFSGVKRMFFVTNLLTNLPYSDLLDLLTEEEKKRKVKCEELIQEAVQLKNNEKYGNALKKLKEASAMNIAEKESTIRTIKNEIEELKGKNSLASRFGKWLNDMLDEDNN